MKNGLFWLTDEETERRRLFSLRSDFTVRVDERQAPNGEVPVNRHVLHRYDARLRYGTQKSHNRLRNG
jgi:hypothetical protein